MAVRYHALSFLSALCLFLAVTASVSMETVQSEGLVATSLANGRRLLSSSSSDNSESESEGGKSPPSPPSPSEKESEGGKSPPSPPSPSEKESESEGGKSPPSPPSPSEKDSESESEGGKSPPSPPSKSGSSDDSNDDSGKNSTANCKGDPHFTGADGSHFDFSGVPNHSYCLLTDSHLHLNAWFGGYYGQYEENPHKALTWMRKVGVLWGHHTMLFEAREGAAWEYGSGYMAAIVVDGERVILSQAGDSATFADGSILIKWESAKEKSGDDEIDVYSLRVGNVLSLKMELRPEVAALRTETDGTVHFDLYFPETRLSQSVHGVLGQTFRPDHANRLSQQKLVFNSLLNTEVVPGDNAAGFLDGAVEDYESSDMLVADCRVSRFSRSSGLDAETATAIELSMNLAGAPAVVSNSGLPRKMLLAGF